MPTDYEIALNEFMPAFKVKAAEILVTKNSMSQQKAANLLGLSQAAISKYINGIYSKSIEKSLVKIDDNAMERFVHNISKDNGIAAQRAICKACQSYNKFNCAIMIK